MTESAKKPKEKGAPACALFIEFSWNYLNSTNSTSNSKTEFPGIGP